MKLCDPCQRGYKNECRDFLGQPMHCCHRYEVDVECDCPECWPTDDEMAALTELAGQAFNPPTTPLDALHHSYGMYNDRWNRP